MDKPGTDMAVPPCHYCDPRALIGVAEPVARETAGVSDVVTILWRRKGVIAMITALGTLAGLIPGLVRPPVYRARTSLQLEGFNENYLNFRDVTPVSPVVANASAEAYLQNQFKILQSESLAKRVAAKIWPNVGAPPAARVGILSRFTSSLRIWNAAPVAEEDRRLDELRKALTVRTSLQSQVLEVLYDSPDPALAARIANAFATEYITMNRETRWQGVQDTTEWLSQQIADLKTKLVKSGQELQDYGREAGLLFTTDQGSLALERMRQLQEALSRADAERASRQSRYEAAAHSASDALPEILDNPQLREFQSNLVGLERQASQLTALYTPSHYKVRQVNAEIADLKAVIAKTRQHILDRIHGEFESAQNLQRLIMQEYTQQGRMVEKQAERQARYDMLKREVATTQQLYDSMLQKVKEAGVASALRATNIRIIDPASPPREAYSPNNSLNCAVGFAMGLFLGLVVIVTQEHTDNRVRHPGDTRLLNLREIGVIPSAAEDPSLHESYGLRVLRQTSEPLELVTWHHGPSLLAESFRGTLASILFSPHQENPPGVLAVTSVDSMEGKTTVLSNLGIALAETNRRVLLVDADLRRPRLHKVFDVCNDRGLTDLLGGADPIAGAPIDALVRNTQIPRLDLMPSGPGVARVANLLYSKRLSEALDRFRADYDIVLIDTPPMSAFADARVLGRRSDGVILVVRSGKTSKAQIRATAMQFMEDRTPVHGAILNDWRGNTGIGRYGYFARPYAEGA
jgi:capsular exopolysaccharide synthesis family protein